eukprot:CAMPEP_0175360902 /NCGR_PEP_ID=MMETSP0095-20121207/16277_1 /TAXON_ID=311494 /ORGANISM="Alexandrium monilatum, Strain CCMP3105" /LENGTH=80 /DNA_ID=CAMNT_0016658725 /DNA_START=71 /DNA_END=310 /DNA_ORIENTATION=-
MRLRCPNSAKSSRWSRVQTGRHVQPAPMQPCTRASVRTDARASPWASSASSRGVLHADDLEAPGRELWREAGLGMCVEDL